MSVLVDSAEPLVHAKLGNNDTLFFVMPRRFVEQRVVQPKDTCIRPLTASSMALGRLAQQSLITLEQNASLISEPEFQSACRLTGDLVLLALGGTEDGRGGHLSIRRATLAKVKRVIRARLDDPDLTLTEIAGECHISLGYLHSLFREDGRTAWEHLKGERLQRARNLLESPAEGTTVTDVALACGFSNMSQFSTAFGRAFGICPRDILRQRGTPVKARC
jgi:AraC-like DNA-binding protein